MDIIEIVIENHLNDSGVCEFGCEALAHVQPSIDGKQPFFFK